MKTKEVKRSEAKIRQEKYNNLSEKKKLLLIKNRPGKSQKEAKRIRGMKWNFILNADAEITTIIGMIGFVISNSEVLKEG